MEGVIRTVKIKLDVSTERCDDLHQTKDRFLHCVNTTSEWAWRHPNDYCIASKQKAENTLYERLRDETELTASLVRKGIRRAIEATKSGVARLDKGEKTRGSIQQTGTRSAHLSTQSMDDREHRWIQNKRHPASNQILEEARTHVCTHVTFENLTDIRDRMGGAKRFHAWAFRRLSEYVEYKSESFGIEAEQVIPLTSPRLQSWVTDRLSIRL